MTIYLSKKSGKYRCEPRINGKRLKSKSFSRKSDALKYEREMIQAEEELIAKGSLAKDYQYQELFNIWYSDAKLRKASSSLVKDFQMNRDYVAPRIGKLRVSEINAIHFNKMTASMKKVGLADSSINKVIQQYKAVLNYAYKHDLIVKNPSKAVAQIKIPELKINFLEKQELKKLLAQLDINYPINSDSRWVYVFNLALFFTGARLGEVRGLMWENINFERESILICCAWSNTNNSLKLYPKGKRWRTIPLHKQLREELLRMKIASSSKWVFPSSTGSKPIDDSNFRTRHWNKLFKKLDVKRITIHEARHTFASIFMMNGGNIYDLKKIIGHIDVKTTERYIHFSPNHLLEARNIINLNL